MTTTPPTNHINRVHDNTGPRLTEWLVATTHGVECQACNASVSAAIGIAKATGSVGATHNDNGVHAARVTRKA